MPRVAGYAAESPEQPVSPELVLVSDPEEARRARERLPEMPGFVPVREPRPTRQARDREWEGFLADLRARELAVQHVEDVETPRRAWSRRRLVIALSAVLVVGATVGALSVQHGNGNEHQRSAAISALPPPPVTGSAPQPRQATKPATRRERTARTSQPKTSQPKQTKSKPTKPKPKVGKFVPARVWSWPARAGARAYVITFFRNGNKVLQARTRRPRYVVPKNFAFRPGRYHWTVMPVGGARKAPLVDSNFVVS
jgi:hypothetical protein